MKLHLALLLLVTLLVCHLHAEPPQATGVEPPSWWLNSSVNPVRILIHGKNLKGANITAPAGTTVSNLRTNKAGTYLFADFALGPAVEAGRKELLVATVEGRATAPFELLPPLKRAGSFQGFSQDDVIYLIMPDRFANGDSGNDDPEISRGLLDRSKSRYYHGGDLQGVINRLPYLKELGITAIWLNPIYDNVNYLNTRERYDNAAITDYHGYGAVDFYSVEEHFGTLEKYRELVEAAHKLGIRVIQDQVANHTGPFHPWVQDSPVATWFHGTEANHPDNNWQTWTLMDPHASDALRRPVLDGWFINILPDLNQEDPEVARYLIQNSLWWVGVSGGDAIRQDTLPYVSRRYWRQWMAALKKEFPQVNVVGEVMDSSVPLVSFFQKGRKRFDGIDSGIDTVFDYPGFFALRHVFGEGKSMRDLAYVLAQDYLYPAPQKLVTLIGSHDVKRFMNELQGTITRLRMAFTYLLTVRGIPQLYYGDEIAMRGGGDPDNRRDFPGGFPGDTHNAFSKEGRTAEEQEVFEHVQKLIALRKELAPLRWGSLVTLAVSDNILVYARVLGHDAVLVAFNNGTEKATVDVEVSSLPLAEGMELIERVQNANQVTVKDRYVRIELRGASAVVFTRK